MRVITVISLIVVVVANVAFASEGVGRVARLLAKQEALDEPEKAFAVLKVWVDGERKSLFPDKELVGRLDDLLKLSCIYDTQTQCSKECLETVDNFESDGVSRQKTFPYSSRELMRLTSEAFNHQAYVCQGPYARENEMELEQVMRNPQVQAAYKSFKEIEQIHENLDGGKTWSRLQEVGLSLTFRSVRSEAQVKSLYKWLKNKSIQDKHLDLFRPDEQPKVQSGETSGITLDEANKAQKIYLKPACDAFTRATEPIFGKYLMMYKHLKPVQVHVITANFSEKFGIYIYCNELKTSYILDDLARYERERKINRAELDA